MKVPTYFKKDFRRKFCLQVYKFLYKNGDLFYSITIIQYPSKIL
ncbi:hypothetical protein SAMN05444267_103052 [Chryseobacterium polytrichastri]|uniref:Uncharacterized protein n=1 Tax=Chryseobacterium polytrichastri TaxID=1302687 RepID=A0A1M7F548_9FLAO|nr:hypothetical protein SAMN05444267_103052 [Chryseobacterium polytrichastri]